MSFFRHEEIYRPMDVRIVPGRPAHDRPRPHRYDEFPAGYSSAGCAPAEPASASPAEAHLAGIGPGSTIDLQRTANRLLTPCLTQGDSLSLSLAETIAWCATQKITPIIEETEQGSLRRQKIEEADKLHSKARRKGISLWNRLLRRDYTKNPEWKLAIELYRQAQVLPLPLTSQLRSPNLKPNCPIGEAPEQERRDLVFSVIAKRSDALSSESQSVLPNVPENLHGGRLMIYVPGENVQDGASQEVSRGFFDVCDAPPWDTWVAYANKELLIWVPPELIDLAQAGIDVNPVECIGWLD